MKLKDFSAVFSVVAMIGSISSAEPPEHNPLPIAQDWLSQAFSNKTWEWDDGHAYFGPDGDFQAVVGRTQSAKGEWYTAPGGKVCFKAEWSSGNTAAPAKKCWKHVADEQKQVWQAPLEGGLWYNFSRFDPRDDLVTGNIYEYRYQYVTGQRPGINAKPLEARAVADTFLGKTWTWKNGHGYFGNDGTFTAIAGDNEIGEGKWYATSQGRLCVDATWTSPEYGSVENKRCWRHAKDEKGTIWQSPTDQNWAWSVFAPRDNLVRGNVYAKRFARQKKRLGQ